MSAELQNLRLSCKMSDHSGTLLTSLRRRATVVWAGFLFITSVVNAAPIYKVEAHGNGVLQQGTCVAVAHAYDSAGNNKGVILLGVAHILNIDGQYVRECYVFGEEKAHKADVLIADTEADLSMLFVPGVQCAEIAPVVENPARQGLVAVGWRLGRRTVRSVSVSQIFDTFTCDAGSICSGDSGGGVVNNRGELVAIIQKTHMPLDACGNVIEPCGRQCITMARCSTWMRSSCPGGICPGPQYRVWPMPGTGGIRFQPPIVNTPPSYMVQPIREPEYQKTPTPQYSPPPVTAPTIVKGEKGDQGDRGPGPTSEQIAAAVIAYMEVNADRFRGADGRNGLDGKPGRDGVDGLPGRDGVDGRSPTPEEISLAVSAWMEAHREELRGPAGLPGRDGAGVDQAAIIASLKALQAKQPELFRGPQGVGGTVSVVIMDRGNEIARHSNLSNGTTVVVDIEKFLTQENKINGSK